MGMGRVLVAGALCAVALWACAPATTGGDGGAEGGSDGAANASQTPPQGHAALQAWLATGAYRQWHCEAAPHPGQQVASTGSPHGLNRICTNDALASAPTSGAAPVGAAAVKELYMQTDGGTPSIIGYAVYLKLSEGTDGANWYWYEAVPPGSSNSMLPNPIMPNGVVADGVGAGAGNALPVCVGCHRAGNDFTFTRVR